MPEGDTVFRAATELRGALAGRGLARSDFRVPRYATADLSGQTVTEVVPRGKHLMIRTDAGLSVHTHLKMEGRWRGQAVGERLFDSYRIRLVLANAQWQEGAAGEAARRLRAAPDRATGEALLDQRNLAGIGNVFAAEILFLGGVDPWRPVGKVSDVDALVDLAYRLLQANKDRTRRVTTGVDRPGQHVWVYGRAGKPCRRCGTR